MRVGLAVLCVLGLGGAAVADTANVDFSGTVLSVCSLLLSTNGTLGLSADGGAVSSDGALGGLPGTVTILSIGSGNSVEIAAPTRTGQPVDYDDTNETVQVHYQGVSGLSWVDVAWTDQTTTFNPGSIAASVLTIHNRIVNPDGFTAGNYGTRTVVTCAP